VRHSVNSSARAPICRHPTGIVRFTAPAASVAFACSFKLLHRARAQSCLTCQCKYWSPLWTVDMGFRSSPPYPKTKTSIHSHSPSITSVPVPMLSVADHRSAGGTSLKENCPTQAWSLHRKNASQSGKDPCLLSRKRKKGHTCRFRKAWRLLLQTTWQALVAPQHPFDCHRAWQLLGLDNIEPHRVRNLAWGNSATGGKLRWENFDGWNPSGGSANATTCVNG
jgi:hypothetical protein